MKIAVLTLAVGEEFKRKVHYANLSLQEYSKKHGYDYIDDSTICDHTRPIPWSKILLIMRYLPTYDYVVWIDADAMILDLEQKLEDKIQLMNDKLIMVGMLDSCINTGVMFVKNDPMSYIFLMTLYNQTQFVSNKYYGNFEQDAFQYMLEKDIDNMAKYIHILPEDMHLSIQSFLRNLTSKSFILHLAGFREERLNWTVSGLFKRFYPLQREDETVEHYQSRIEWFNTHLPGAIERFYNTDPFSIIERV